VKLIKALVLSLLVVFITSSASAADFSGTRSHGLVLQMITQQSVPLLPTWEDCRRIGDAHQEALETIQGYIRTCRAENKLDASSCQDLGSDCREWAGREAASLGWCNSCFPDCYSVERDWYQVIVHRDKTVRQCHAEAARRDKDSNAGRSALARERAFYERTHDLAESLDQSDGLRGKIVGESMDEIRRRHQRTLDELEQLIEDLEDFQ
jgi:hypothetical protein